MILLLKSAVSLKNYMHRGIIYDIRDFLITYLCLCLNVLRTVPLAPIRYGTILISIVVILRHAVRYEKEPLQIRLLKRNR